MIHTQIVLPLVCFLVVSKFWNILKTSTNSIFTLFRLLKIGSPSLDHKFEMKVPGYAEAMKVLLSAPSLEKIIILAVKRDILGQNVNI